MKSWQGPALYFYNNGIFKEQDFKNISSIGQGSKLDNLLSTGRFGLGFNSVYHITDVPTFVSGENLVIFDPHVSYLPRISHANPGLKMKFVNSNLRQQFPDQFEPYLQYGCDLENYYNGTLFRFPLRSSETAKDSQIKNSMYNREDIDKLFQSLCSQAASLLLFLKNIRKISVLRIGADGNKEVKYIQHGFYILDCIFH
jgi:sacsin